MQELIIPLVGWNVLTFLLMGIDKYNSVKGHWRVKESTLLAAAFAMGGMGCLAGSLVFRHKTRKPKFRILLPLALLFNLAVIILVVNYF
jgi:uncharacterized membrane protein YsdA (DUF1294 family)